MERLELTVLVKLPKRLEFKQTLDDLHRQLQKYCTEIKIGETDKQSSYSIKAEWKTAEQMQRTFNSDAFEILSGAITALCEKTEIQLNDSQVGYHISMLTKDNKLKM